MFTVGNAFILFAGWWDWWALSKQAHRVYDGMITKNTYQYENTGLKIEIELTDMGTLGIDKLVDLNEVGLPTAKNPVTALYRIADYLGLDLILNWSNDPMDTGLKNLIGAYNLGLKHLSKPWLYRDRSGKVVAFTVLRTVLDNIAKTYSKDWYIRGTFLYFGLYEKEKKSSADYSSSRVKKIYRHRLGHEASEFSPEWQNINHVDQETFAQIEVTEPTVQAMGALDSPSAEKKKSGSEVAVKKPGRTVIWYTPDSAAQLKTHSAIQLEQQALYAQIQAQKDAAQLQKDYLKTEMRKTEMGDTLSLSMAGKTPEQKKMILTEFSKRLNAQGEIKLRVSEALGDPTMNIGDEIFFEGVSKHTGVWTVGGIEQIISVGNMQYSMTLECSKSGAPFLAALPKALQDQIHEVSKLNAKANMKKAQWYSPSPAAELVPLKKLTDVTVRLAGK
jgi:hypothetical protein